MGDGKGRCPLIFNFWKIAVMTFGSVQAVRIGIDEFFPYGAGILNMLGRRIQALRQKIQKMVFAFIVWKVVLEQPYHLFCVNMV